MRATSTWRDGALWVKPQPLQDSSMLKMLAASDVLIVRKPHAPALERGATIDVLAL